MKVSTRLVGGALSALALLGGNAYAQDVWPSRPITYVAAFPAGSNTDLLGRIIAQKLSEVLKVPVVVDNKAGATGVVGSAYVAKAAPDGYTLLGASIASHAIMPAMNPTAQYDPIKSFEPLTIIGMNANVLVVPVNSPYKSVADIIAAAKADPGGLAYASSGIGTTQHLSGELFQKLAGIKMTHVPYAKTPALADVIAGQVPMMFEGPTVFQHILGGRVRALAVTSATRLPSLPNVPTMAEAGVPGYEVQAWQAIWAPAGVPKPILNRLYTEIAAIIRRPDTTAQLEKMGVIPSAMAPEAFAAFQKAEVEKWGQLIRSAGIQLQ
ncbi:MAG: tripartite tricarboxylate transporter substrate binding protein [Pseudomonadota bacterium]